jgi:hypothetical protein
MHGRARLGDTKGSKELVAVTFRLQGDFRRLKLICPFGSQLSQMTIGSQLTCGYQLCVFRHIHEPTEVYPKPKKLTHPQYPHPKEKTTAFFC